MYIELQVTDPQKNVGDYPEIKSLKDAQALVCVTHEGKEVKTGILHKCEDDGDWQWYLGQNFDLACFFCTKAPDSELMTMLKLLSGPKVRE